MTLTRRIMVDTVKARTGWKRHQAQFMVDMVLNQIQDAIARGDDVHLQEFGRWKVIMVKGSCYDFKNHRKMPLPIARVIWKVSWPMKRRLHKLLHKDGPLPLRLRIPQ